MPNVKLSKPITIDGQLIESIDLNFENLTGKDILAIDKELRARNSQFSVYDIESQVLVVSKISGIIPDDLEKLHAPDFLDVTSRVTLFLLNLDSKEQATSEK